MNATAAVVVPCYDEARRLPSQEFLAFLRANPSVSMVLVDDGSTDATLDALRAIERELPDRVDVVALPQNRGKAEAVRIGLLRALEREVEHVGYWDADLATPLSEICHFSRLLEERPGIEIVMGARVVLLGREVKRHPFRHYLGRGAATAIALVLGMPVYDTQCGAKLFRVTPDLRELFAEPFVAGWTFDVEVLARYIRARGGRGGKAAGAICEVPLERWVDVPGSSVRPRAYLQGLLDLFRIYRRYLRGDVPRLA